MLEAAKITETVSPDQTFTMTLPNPGAVNGKRGAVMARILGTHPTYVFERQFMRAKRDYFDMGQYREFEFTGREGDLFECNFRGENSYEIVRSGELVTIDRAEAKRIVASRR